MLYLVPMADTVVAAGSSSVDPIYLVNVVLGSILPILVGLVTAKVTSPGVKATLLLLLSAVSGFLTEFVVASGDFDWVKAALNWAVTFVVGVAMHFGYWSKVKAGGSEPISRKVQGVRMLTLFDRNSEAGFMDLGWAATVAALGGVLAFSLRDLMLTLVIVALVVLSLYVNRYVRPRQEVRRQERHRALRSPS